MPSSTKTSQGKVLSKHNRYYDKHREELKEKARIRAASKRKFHKALGRLLEREMAAHEPDFFDHIPADCLGNTASARVNSAAQSIEYWMSAWGGCLQWKSYVADERAKATGMGPDALEVWSRMLADHQEEGLRLLRLLMEIPDDADFPEDACQLRPVWRKSMLLMDSIRVALAYLQ